jgi:hypothetical protein
LRRVVKEGEIELRAIPRVAEPQRKYWNEFSERTKRMKETEETMRKTRWIRRIVVVEIRMDSGIDEMAPSSVHR